MSVRPKLHVAHVITDLGPGGAETMLYRVASATCREGLRHSVLSLSDDGVFGERLVAAGIPVTCLGMMRSTPGFFLALLALIRWLRRERPDVVQSWMYHADLLAGLAASAAGRIPVVWGIHHSNLDRRTTKRLTRYVAIACARLSGVLPSRIVCCAHAARRAHAELGYRLDRMVVIPNGFDPDRFVANPVDRNSIRREFSIPDEAPVVGLIARFHPDKDHRGFLEAARIVAREDRDVVFVLAGESIAWSNEVLCAWIDHCGLRARVRLLGVRSDVPRILSAVDVVASSSSSEGLPLLIGEAMLCGVPCAATDCGDSREIVGPTGRIVPPRDPAALATAILELLALAPDERVALGAAARERVVANYDICAVARRYAALYAEVSGRFSDEGGRLDARGTL